MGVIVVFRGGYSVQFRKGFNMAKEGIESFLLDCHTNDNLAEIEAEFNIKGFAILVRLWQKIYSEKGYYCEWVERSPLLFLSQWFGGNSGVTVNLINEIVNRSINIGIFNKELYTKYKILTSERIQRQYFDVVKRRTEINFIDEYLLISVANFKGNVNIFSISVDRNAKIVNKNDTSKVKESKVKESKGERENTPTLDDVKAYCIEKGYDNYNYEKFYNYYSSNGWTIKGGVPLVNWQAKLDNWYKEDSKPAISTPKGIFNGYKQKHYNEGELEEILRRKNGNV